MARYGNEGKPEKSVALVSRGTRAKTVGTTQSWVSFFMNKFRKLGRQIRWPLAGESFAFRVPSFMTDAKELIGAGRVPK
jgi:hypothetical protein